MKRLATFLCILGTAATGSQAAVPAPPPAARPAASDRCDVEWLNGIATKDASEIVVDNQRIVQTAAGARIAADSDVCEPAVWNYAARNKNPNLVRLWRAADIRKQAKVLLWADDVFKVSDAKAQVVFQKADAILQQAAAAKLLNLQNADRTLAQAAKTQGRSPSVDDAINAADAAPVDARALAAADADAVRSLRDQLIGAGAAQSAGGDGQATRPDAGIKPGPLWVAFNAALIDWINALAPLQARGRLFNRRVAPAAPAIFDLMTARQLPAGGVNAGLANNVAGMGALYQLMTDKEALKWDDASEGRSFLAGFDKAQRNALAIRLADVLHVVEAAQTEIKKGPMTAPRDVHLPDGHEPPQGEAGNDAVVQSAVAASLGVGSKFDPQTQTGRKDGAALTGDDAARIMAARGIHLQNGRVTGTPLDGGAPVEVDNVQTDERGNLKAGEADRIAQALLAGHAAQADLTAAFIAAKPGPTPTGAAAASGAPADAVKKGAGCDGPMDAFRSDVSRFKKHQESAIHDASERSLAARRDKQKQFDDESAKFMEQCRAQADENDRLDKAAHDAYVAHCQARVEQRRKDLNAQVQQSEQRASQTEQAARATMDRHLDEHYFHLVPASAEQVRKELLNPSGVAWAQRREDLVREAGRLNFSSARPDIEAYFKDNWQTQPKAQTTINDCAVKKLKPNNDDPDGDNVWRRCIHDDLLAAVRRGKGAEKTAPNGPDFSFDATIRQ